MPNQTKALTIVRDLARYSDYPYLAIRPAMLLQFSQAYDLAEHPGIASGIQHSMRLLECFLQVTGQELDVALFNSSKFLSLAGDFINALGSEKFWNATKKRRYMAVRDFLQLCSGIGMANHANWTFDDLLAEQTGPRSKGGKSAASFEVRGLNDEKVWIWHGWKVVDLGGRSHWLPLLGVYQRLGRTFTERIFHECETYCNAHHQGVPSPLLVLFRFIGTYPSTIHADTFRDQRFVTSFWREFLVHYFERGYRNGDGAQVGTLTALWRNNFASFVKQHLTATGLFAASFGGFPMPKAKQTSGAKTNIRKNGLGHEVKTKLITHVPLQFNDEEALTKLFDDLDTEVATLIKWAGCAVADLNTRFENAQQLAKVGAVRSVIDSTVVGEKQWETNRSNPAYLANSAATLAHYGHLTREDTTIQLMFAMPLPQIAFELGMPTTGSLVPHCTLLVANHPAITPSYLENCELFDRNGKLQGFVETDGGFYLTSLKRRRGRVLAQQQILLNAATVMVVRQIIELTESVRAYLRRRNDDNWRYLLLTCGRGFGYPVRIKRLASETSIQGRLDTLATSFVSHTNLTFPQARDLVSRFSLTSLRASMGVLKYLETQSVNEMSKTLGHARYEPELLERYLPAPIIEFFQERWIRIFQTGLIVQAMEHSEHLLGASGFATMCELDEFLSNHRIVRRNTEPSSELSLQDEKAEVIFSVNKEIVALLNNLQIAVSTASSSVTTKAQHWATLAENVIAHMRDRQSHRDDFREYLEYANANEDPKSMEKVIYVD